MENGFYWHWFHSLKGIGQKEKEELLVLCDDTGKWYEAARKRKTEDLFPSGLTKQQTERKKQIKKVLEEESNQEESKKTFESLYKNGIKITARQMPDFPSRLREVYLSPFVLYYKGKLPLEHSPTIGIIGSRNCSVYGEETAKEFAASLADAGIQVISGMARGIDGSAQRSAVKRKGSSYAVLGSGVDVCYPSEYKALYEELYCFGGVMSEELPGTPPFSYNFPKRNRIIAGLSDALLVVEAKEKSGSLITVSYALEQGKEIYAVPGRIYDHLADGTNQLIQDGAFLVREPEDILHNFCRESSEIFMNSKKNEKLSLETKEKIVYACLSLQPKHMEQISIETKLPLVELYGLLFEMEQKKYISQPIKNYYMIRSQY